ncbi:MAG: DUF3616 domain-containing protein [Myxococcaceae bacterium]
MRNGQLLGRVLLKFAPGAEDVPGDLSAAARGRDGSLWLASDERAYLEQVSPTGPHVYGDHRRLALSDYLEVLTDPEEELDLEAIEFHRDELWFVGSHSAKRKKPKKAEKALERLGTVVQEPARLILGHVRAPTGGGAPQAPARRLPVPSDHGSAPEGLLVDMLRDDPHLAPFLAIPSKDNGLDIEGLAVTDERVWLGLRGPVLRGHAVLLELAVELHGENLLVPRPIEGGRPYRKHLLHLDGLGIRELCRCGDDLLILAGPTMMLDGPSRLFRLRDGLKPRDEDTFRRQEPGALEPLFDIPWGEKSDHAEGMTLHSWFEEDDSLLVVYDTPAPERCLGESSVLADVFRLA